MMKQVKRNALAAAAALLCVSGNAAAAVSITNVDGTFEPWTGFDLSSASTALIEGFTGDGDTFTLTFWGTMEALKTTANANFNLPGLDTGLGDTGTYEYTFFGSLTEVATCAVPSSCTFAITSGSINMYYDTTPDADYTTGAGITDGTVLLTGTAAPQSGGTFTAVSTTSGVGVATLVSDITFTEPTLIDPALSTATTVATLQLGVFTTGNWVIPTTRPAGGGGTAALGGNPLPNDAQDGNTFFAMQIDGNVGIEAAVPEPASVGLFGLGLAALSLVRRRRDNAV